MVLLAINLHGTNWQNALFVLHILSTVYFALGVVLATIFTLQVPNVPTLKMKAQVMGQSSKVARTMIVPGSILAGGSGFLLTYAQGLSLQTHWVLFSTLLFFAAFLVGGASGPISARTRRTVEQEARGGKKPTLELIKALRSPTPIILMGLNLAILIGLLFLMFVQPN